MTTVEPRPPDDSGSPALADLPAAGQILVRSDTPPAVPSEQYIDVRTGGVATFDGERVRLPLWISDGRDRVSIDWSELGKLDATVAGRLRGGTVEVIRFGGRASCRLAVGSAGVASIERRLAETARDARATLVTWTVAAPRDGDYRTYDEVLDGAGTTVG